MTLTRAARPSRLARCLAAVAVAVSLACAAVVAPAQETDDWSNMILAGRHALDAGDPAAALEQFRKAYALVQSEKRPDKDMIVSLTSLGLAYSALGKLDLAVEYHQRSLDLREKTYDENSKAVATGLRNLAGVRQLQGQMPEAATLLRRALDIVTAVEGADSDDGLAVRLDLASVYYALARYKDALAIYDGLHDQVAAGPPGDYVMLLTNAAAAHEAGRATPRPRSPCCARP